jgi:glucose/mannose-6-phosphate isomerase
MCFEKAVTLLLRTDFDHPRTAKRMDICLDIFSKVAPEIHQIHAKGKSFIAQSLYLTHLLDWVSFYLAEENNVDPFPVDAISHLKNELAKV